MAKKYYKSARRGVSSEMLEESLGKEFYAGVMDKRAQEMRDGQMLHEDRNAIANLPQEVIYREYPKTKYAMDYDLDDSQVGVDRQMNEDFDGMQKVLKPRKY